MIELYEVIGLIGVGLVFLSYLLLQVEKLSPDHLAYSLMNLAGAGMIASTLLHDWNLSTFVIEICWSLVSLYGIYKALRKKRKTL